MVEKEKVRQVRLKKILVEKKRQMWNDLRQEIFNKLGKEYNKQFDSPQDLEELSLIDVIEDTGLAIADMHREELTKMDAAIGKLEDGTYGICEDCESEIDEERLKAVPLTPLCVKCQAKKEGKKPTL